MDVTTGNLPSPSRTTSPPDELARLLGPGVMSLAAGGTLRFADSQALELLGCADGFELERLWAALKARLERAGLSWSGSGDPTHRAAIDLPVAATSEPGEGISGLTAPNGTIERQLAFDFRHDPEGGGILLVHDRGVLTGLEADLRLASQLRSLAQISPAVAHDLRAPINAMVFNIEILKEMLVSGRAADPTNKDKLLRYVSVLREELQRLHQGLETFLAYISPRSDKRETVDLRELAAELASLLVAPARKQQAQVEPELPAGPLSLLGNRYLLRQALLHLALAALAGTPKQGRLYVHLEGAGGRARIRLFGVAGADSPPAPAAAFEPPPGFELRFSPAGSQAQLWAARAILAAHGGEVRAAAPSGGPGAYEVELTIPGNPASEERSE
jgi:signal transduction histidine kinase